MAAHEKLIEPRVTMDLLPAKPRSLSNLPAFLDYNGSQKFYFQSLLTKYPTEFTITPARAPEGIKNRTLDD